MKREAADEPASLFLYYFPSAERSYFGISPSITYFAPFYGPHPLPHLILHCRDLAVAALYEPSTLYSNGWVNALARVYRSCCPSSSLYIPLLRSSSNELPKTASLPSLRFPALPFRSPRFSECVPVFTHGWEVLKCGVGDELQCFEALAMNQCGNKCLRHSRKTESVAAITVATAQGTYYADWCE